MARNLKDHWARYNARVALGLPLRPRKVQKPSEVVSIQLKGAEGASHTGHEAAAAPHPTLFDVPPPENNPWNR